MAKLSYYYINPTGNITLLVDSPVRAQDRGDIARRLIKAEPEAEQVGFICGKSLCMAGGEFCGNATLSAAAVYCLENGFEEATVEMTVSGAQKPVRAEIKKTGFGEYSGRIEMPEPLKIEEVEFNHQGETVKAPAVFSEGIIHIIMPPVRNRDEYEKIIPELCFNLNADSLGMMFIEGESLTPLVYTTVPGTAVWESSCASGTTAAGVYLASLNGGYFKGKFKEPGGELGIEICPGKKPILSGTAKITARKSIDV